MEIPLYSPINSDTASAMMQYLGWMNDGDNTTVRMYCPGGEVEAAWGIAAKMQEMRAKGCTFTAKVDGMAASMAGELLAYFDNTEALSVSNIMIHKASLGLDPETGEEIVPTPTQKEQLDKINKDLKSALSAVVDNIVLKAIKGYDLNDLFAPDKPRVDCWLTAKEAQKIGLIKTVVALNPVTKNIMAKAVALAYNPAELPKPTAGTAGQKSNAKMTAEELKKSDPECYKAIFTAGAKAYQKQCVDALDIDESEMPEPDSECAPKKKAKAKAVTEDQINAAVEAKLKEYGISAISQTQPAQTAVATATLFATKPVDGTTKTPEQLAAEKALADTQAEINAIIHGKAQ